MRHQPTWARASFGALLFASVALGAIVTAAVVPARAQAQESRGEDPAPAWVDNWSLGGGLIAAGLILLAPGIVTAAQHGQCSGAASVLLADGTLGCSEIYDVVESLPWLIAGSVAALAGALVLILQPFEVRLHADARSANVSIRGYF